MICGAEHIEQSYSGEYVEKIYDVKTLGIQIIGLGLNLKKRARTGVENLEENIGEYLFQKNLE